MCPCCVQSMLKLNLTGESFRKISLIIVLNAVLSRLNEAQEKFKRCCIAFADLCCAHSKTETGCCETACQDEYGTLVPHLDYSGNTGTSKEVAEGLHSEKEGSAMVNEGEEAGVEEEIVLEVVGMDCPDCLSKVTQAVRILSGAEVTNADGVRGLVNVKYDPRENNAPLRLDRRLIDQVSSILKPSKPSQLELLVSQSTFLMVEPSIHRRH